MLHLIAIHPFVALLVLFIASLVVAWIVELVIDRWAVRMPDASDIEPGDFNEPQLACAWCARERAMALDPNESHSICQRHAAQVMAESKRFKHAA